MKRVFELTWQAASPRREGTDSAKMVLMEGASACANE